ncbi:hypothetical protein MUS1_02950 [Marinomonas ushuaiensis DSM 15871]|uniref:Cadherin domain-containing protein n=1 Tax=Marinomonas ushuaiensis DSM 15871 TaxID=1122207 RepID=X7E9S2_9GAMM|nr:hypothetical protein [Marinomonas ushuaiensis]ETX12702.1 hypothetical protein MUS1_02950 [Marinomonas ushuaiensis DSM 15871]
MLTSVHIIKRLANTPLQQLQLGAESKIEVEQGAIYSLVDAETGLYPDGVILKQEEDNLLIEKDGEVLLVIQDFYNELNNASMDDTGSILPNSVYVASDIQTAEQPIWDAETSTVITLDDQPADSIPQTAGSQQSSTPSTSPSDATNTPSNSENTEQPSDATGAESSGGLGWGWYAGAGLGLLGGAALAGGSSSGSGGSSGSSISINPSAGAFFSEVQIDIYKASGELLSSVEHNYEDGDYVFTSSYSGPILVEIVDINGTDGDYIDETTGVEKSLGTTALRAMATTDGESAETISVTPLTELATQLAGVVTGEAITADNVAVNAKVAGLFGLDNILAKPAVVGDEDSSDGDTTYGEILAILSGADSVDGKTTVETITQISEMLSSYSTDNLVLSSDVIELLAKGEEKYSASETGKSNPIASDLGFTTASLLVDSSGEATIGTLNATSVVSTINVKVYGAEANDTVTLSLNGEETPDYTLLSTDVVNGYALVNVPDNFFESGSDGAYVQGVQTITITVTDSDDAISTSTVSVNIDTVAPSSPTFSLDEDTGNDNSDGITNDNTVNVELASDVDTWEYSLNALDAGATWTTGSNTSFELEENTTYAAGSIQVRQTNLVGNVSEVVSNQGEITTDTTSPDAPDFELNEDTGVSDLDLITNDTTVNITLSDDDVSWEYSLDSGDTWLDGEDSSFELEENATYGAGSIKVRQTDLAGNMSEVVSNQGDITTDTTPPDAPVFSLNEDSGSDNADGITNDVKINVELSDDVDSWEYSLDSGSSWTTGSNTSFELGENTTYVAESIQVRQTDLAGNLSGISSNGIAIITDTVSPDDVVILESVSTTQTLGNGVSVTGDYTDEEESTNGFSHNTDKSLLSIDNGYIYSWFNTEANDETALDDVYLNVQVYNNEDDTSSFSKILVDINTPEDGVNYERYYSELKVVPVGQSGNFTVTWVGSYFENAVDSDDYLEGETFQSMLFNAFGGSITPGTIKLDLGTSDPSVTVTSLDSVNQYIVSWLDGNDDGFTSYAQIYDSETGNKVTDGLITLSGGLSSTIIDFDDGSFLVVWNEVFALDSGDDEYSLTLKSQKYSSNGEIIGTESILGASEGSVDNIDFPLLVEEMDSEGTYAIIWDDAANNTFSVQVVNSDGTSSGKIELGTYNEFSNEESDNIVDVTVLNDDNDFAVTWVNADTSVSTQSFHVDGTAINDAFVLPLTSTTESVEDWESSEQEFKTFEVKLIGTQSEQGYFAFVQEVLNSEDTEVVLNEDGEEEEVPFYYTSTHTTISFINEEGVQQVYYNTNESNIYNYYEMALLNDEGDVLISFDNHENSWVQVFNADGSEKSDKITAPEGTAWSNWSLIDGDYGDFLLSWVSINNRGVGSISVKSYMADGSTEYENTVNLGDDLSVTVEEAGVAYLFNIEDINNDVPYDVSVSNVMSYVEPGNIHTINVSADSSNVFTTDTLSSGDYVVLVSDVAGNLALNSAVTLVDAPTEVIIDLAGNESSNAGNFDAEESYEIYINVGDGSNLSFNTSDQWSGAGNLGDDDVIVFVTENSSAFGRDDTTFTWTFEDDSEAVLTANGEFTIGSDTFDLWTGEFASNVLSVHDTVLESLPTENS